MSNGSSRSPWRGSLGMDRRLVVSVDIGTTFSAASFCILQKGKVPKFEEILRWPKQANPDAKVPSVLFYDEDGRARAFGSETDDDETLIEAEMEGWLRVEWWKLHLRPQHLPSIDNLELDKLPKDVTLDQVFADFLRYVKDQLKAYISTTYADGGAIWNTLFPSMCVVLTTPNGWEGRQQNRMRQAAIQAELVTADGARRVKFVTEAEAAVLYTIDIGSVSDWVVRDAHIILCDCGGGTIDVTGYQIKSVQPLRLEESTASRCYLGGAVFINRKFETFLRNQLRGTQWDNAETISHAVTNFECNAKKKFDDPTSASWVQLGGFQSAPALGILRGRLKVTGPEMVKFFAPSLRYIKQGLNTVLESGDHLADKVILVGGLASSPYVFSELVSWGKEKGISVSRPDGPTVKAVANGALAWHIDDTVSSRVAKCHYGTLISIPLEHGKPDFEGRPTYISLSGETKVEGAWDPIVKKNTSIQSAKEFTNDYTLEMDEITFDFHYTTEILVYRKPNRPKFACFPGTSERLLPGFEVICTVEGDLERCFQCTPSKHSPKGRKYRKLSFQVCITLGDTEIAARLRWSENGETVHGPAVVTYD
ncbi:hypothetical protein HYDPIDRAFT_25699 [Hydnomerulius pinastri MD-312]|nr:hypothetical protein HYDPIDRAFT_25699 [Hydnomerulius pinastri MD-312]